jgi:CubicO group peptidase (beta-lactamase class C family)
MPHFLGLLEEAFYHNFESGEEVGASLAVWWDGQVFDFHHGAREKGGTPWDKHSIVPVWSASKGPAAAAALHALDHAHLDLDCRITHFWPSFARAEKAPITVGQLLSHQAGLAALDLHAAVTDHASVIEAIEAQHPLWVPGRSHAYHPRTFGVLLDELVRRLTSAPSLARYWQENFATPFGIDFWFGLPELHDARVARLYPAHLPSPAPQDPFSHALSQADSLSARAFRSPSGLHAIADLNLPATRRLEIPSFGGIASAQALAIFYGILACGGSFEGSQMLSPRALSWLSQTLASGPDLVLHTLTAFSAGMMRPTKASSPLFTHPSCFGHPGAGGSHAFADPSRRLGFAYTMNQMAWGVLPGGRVTRLVETVL